MQEVIWMKQYITSFNFNRSMSELSRRINETMNEMPSLTVHTLSTEVINSSAGGYYIDAIVVFDVAPTVDTLGTPKFAGDVYDNGFKLQANSDPIPCANGKE